MTARRSDPLIALYVEFSMTNQDSVSANSNRGDRAVRFIDLNVKQALPSHLEALLDDVRERALRRRLTGAQVAAERSRRGAGGGIFGDAQSGNENPGVEI